MLRIITFTLITLLAVACKKESGFTTRLAIDQRVVVADAPADTIRMAVYSDGEWTMVANDTASWVTIQKGSGKGNDYAIVAVTNNTYLPRSAKFVFQSGAATDSVQIRQRGLVPKILITATSIQSPAAGAALQTAVDTNIPLDLMSVTYKYDANGRDWISNLQVLNPSLKFNTGANTGTIARSATILLSYLDALGTTTRDSIIVNQLRP